MHGIISSKGWPCSGPDDSGRVVGHTEVIQLGIVRYVLGSRLVEPGFRIPPGSQANQKLNPPSFLTLAAPSAVLQSFLDGLPVVGRLNRVSSRGCSNAFCS